ncbi:hypothetical protein Bhyg_16521, partial [Pseudolycoriella hygida]
MLLRIGCRWSPIVNGLRKSQILQQSARSMLCMDTRIAPSNITKDESDVTTIIKSASTSSELLQAIKNDANRLSAEDTLTALTALFEHQKNASTSISRENIVSDRTFEKLCRSLKRNSPKMELNDVINALKILSYIGTGSKSEIMLSLLHLIKNQINDVSLAHLIFLSKMLPRLDRTPLVEALQIALPLLLQIQIGTKIDYENVSELTELLHFACEHRVSDQCVMNIVNSLILHGEDLSVEQSRSILWSLSDRSFRVNNANCEKLLENAMRAMKRNINREDHKELNTTVDRLIFKYLDDPSKNVKFYDEFLFNTCSDLVVENDLGFENATCLQKEFNKIGFINFKMLNYIIKEVYKYPDLLIEGHQTNVIAFITSLTYANLKSDDLQKIKSIILKSNFLTKNHSLKLQWHRISTELLSLGIECPRIWDIVFSSHFMKLHLQKNKQKFVLRTVQLYQALKVLTDYNVDDKISENLLADVLKMLPTDSKSITPLHKCVEAAFGGESFVYRNVTTELCHLLDNVIVFDKSTLEPIPIEGDRFNVRYNDIPLGSATKQ